MKNLISVLIVLACFAGCSGGITSDQLKEQFAKSDKAFSDKLEPITQDISKLKSDIDATNRNVGGLAGRLKSLEQPKPPAPQESLFERLVAEDERVKLEVRRHAALKERVRNALCDDYDAKVAEADRVRDKRLDDLEKDRDQQNVTNDLVKQLGRNVSGLLSRMTEQEKSLTATGATQGKDNKTVTAQLNNLSVKVLVLDERLGACERQPASAEQERLNETFKAQVRCLIRRVRELSKQLDASKCSPDQAAVEFKQLGEKMDEILRHYQCP